MNKFFMVLLFCIFVPCFAATEQAILPLSFSPQGMPAIDVEIQGKKIPLAFDTVSDYSALSEKTIQEQHLQLLSSSQTKCYHDSNGKKTCVNLFIIPALKIGDFILHNVTGIMRDYMWGKEPEDKFIVTEAYKNGVIGLNVLCQFNVLIDYPHEQVVLMKPGLYPKNYDIKNWIKVPFELNKYGITTQAKINGVNVLLSWITAANHSVIMRPTMAKIANVPVGYTSFAPDQLMVGNKEIPSAEFHIVDEGFPFAVIGSSYFQEHIVFIDFKKQYLLIKE